MAFDQILESDQTPRVRSDSAEQVSPPAQLQSQHRLQTHRRLCRTSFSTAPALLPSSFASFQQGQGGVATHQFEPTHSSKNMKTLPQQNATLKNRTPYCAQHLDKLVYTISLLRLENSYTNDSKVWRRSQANAMMGNMRHVVFV